MNRDSSELYRLVKRYRLDWRHPKELDPIMKMIERDRLRPRLAQIWIRKIDGWKKDQEKCFNPLPTAPDQETLGSFPIELGSLVENGCRIGIRLKPRHLLVAGTTGAGKSNILRRLIDGLDSLNRDNGRVHGDPGP